MAVTRDLHLGGVSVENCLVMCLAVLIEDLVVLLVDLIAVGLSGLLSHSDTAVRHERALQRLVCLKSDDRLEVLHAFVYISRAIRGQA